MRQFCEALALDHSLPLARAGSSATAITIARDDGLYFVITIPDSVLEWFATVYVENKEVWSDWEDYYVVDDESDEQLAGYMRDALREAASQLARLRLRLHEGRVQQWANSRWIGMSLWPLQSDGMAASRSEPRA